MTASNHRISSQNGHLNFPAIHTAEWNDLNFTPSRTLSNPSCSMISIQMEIPKYTRSLHRSLDNSLPKKVWANTVLIWSYVHTESYCAAKLSKIICILSSEQRKNNLKSNFSRKFAIIIAEVHPSISKVEQL